MTTLDNTILNVALPSLQRAFHSSPSGLQWTVDGYILVRASVLFLCGSLGDRFGRRLFFDLGLVVFTFASLSCSLAPTLGALIGFRAVQGFGSAMMTPSSLAIITNTFTDPRQRAQAVGIWSATTGVSTAAGPVIGGLLVETLGWRSVFWVNIPVGLAALVGTRRIAESRADRPRPFDIPGQAAIAVALVTLTYALIAAPGRGWAAPDIVVLLVCSVAGWVAFVVTERRSRNPVLDLKYLANPPMAAAVILAVGAFIALGGFLFFNTLYLQNLRGYSPLQAGLLTVPVTISPVVLAPISGRITGTRGARGPAVAACILTATAMILLTVTISPTTAIAVLVGCYLLLGSGSGLINPPITNAAVSSLPPAQAGVASATTSTARQIGTNLGVALIGSVVFSAAGHGIAGAGFADGLRYGYGVIAGIALVCAAVAQWAFAPRRGGRHGAPW